jgi:hypothetical protein
MVLLLVCLIIESFLYLFEFFESLFVRFYDIGAFKFYGDYMLKVFKITIFD